MTIRGSTYIKGKRQLYVAFENAINHQGINHLLLPITATNMTFACIQNGGQRINEGRRRKVNAILIN
jgi:hypothetical protein